MMLTGIFGPLVRAARAAIVLLTHTGLVSYRLTLDIFRIKNPLRLNGRGAILGVP